LATVVKWSKNKIKNTVHRGHSIKNLGTFLVLPKA